MLKKIFIFLLCLLPWFLASLFPLDYNFYSSLNLPFFALPNYLYSIIWTILYLCISVSIFLVLSNDKFNFIPNYRNTLIINYIFNQLYIFILFTLKNLFLSFVDTILIFVTSLFLYYETKELNKKASKWLLPYVFFNIFTIILSISIYFMNL